MKANTRLRIYTIAQLVNDQIEIGWSKLGKSKAYPSIFAEYNALLNNAKFKKKAHNITKSKGIFSEVCMLL